MNYPYTQLPGPPSFPRSGGRFAVPGWWEVTVLRRIPILLVAAAMAVASCTPEKPTSPTPTRSPVAVCHAPTEDSHPTDCTYRNGAWRPNGKTTPICHARTEDSAITDCDYRNGAWWR